MTRTSRQDLQSVRDNASDWTLFTPTVVGRREVKNRMVYPAVVTNRAIGNRITKELIDYYVARADGGTGLIVSEPMSVHDTSTTSGGIVAGYDPSNADGLKRWAEVVEAQDCRLVAQIFHLGRHHVTSAGRVSLAPTAGVDPASWAVPHRMSTAEVRMMISAFVDMALRLKKFGWSGVELHGAQGFLILQFLSPANDRDDDYGGDLAGRLRFVKEIAAGIRQSCGHDFIVGLKLPSDEGLGQQGLDRAAALAVVESLANANLIDMFAFGRGGPGPTFDQHVPDMTFPPAPFVLELPALKSAAASAKVIGLGRISSAELAESMLRRGDCDLIGLARPLIADPAWPQKVRRGHHARIRPCIYCNVCWAQLPKGQPIACVVNPHLDYKDETIWMSAQSASRRRIAVVGGGPAGLEAAWTAAALGHDVTLFESAQELGGRSVWLSRLPGQNDMSRLLEYQIGAIARYGVKTILGNRVDAEHLKSSRFDLVVLATGSRFVSPKELIAAHRVGVEDIVSATLNITPKPRRKKGRIVLFDQTQTESVYAAAEVLAEMCEQLVILSQRATIGTESPLISIPGIMRRIRKCKIKFHGYAIPISFNNRVLTWRDSIHGKLHKIRNTARVVYATPRVAADELHDALAALGVPTILIGDAKAPRNLLTAVHDGHFAAVHAEATIEEFPGRGAFVRTGGPTR
ncbi:MAG: FAD-dependent oxidoreductase [Rhodospirillaceae bacterium]|nr:FAD-dependent oxidoreductase [Rhodospirillaceae bacterium]